MSYSSQSDSLVPSITRRDRSIIGRLVSAVLSQWPERTRGSPPLDNYLRRDIGLEPIDHRSNYWDHQ